MNTAVFVATEAGSCFKPKYLNFGKKFYLPWSASTTLREAEQRQVCEVQLDLRRTKPLWGTWISQVWISQVCYSRHQPAGLHFPENLTVNSADSCGKDLLHEYRLWMTDLINSDLRRRMKVSTAGVRIRIICCGAECHRSVRKKWLNWCYLVKTAVGHFSTKMWTHQGVFCFSTALTDSDPPVCVCTCMSESKSISVNILTCQWGACFIVLPCQWCSVPN